MNLAAIDLNLLIAFEALLAERNVSRAARRIGLTQPAMSNALARLRALFADELFVRTPREMRPSARALELAGSVCEALQHIRTALDRPAMFDARTTERSFTVGASDNVDFSLAPAFSEARRAAPRADFEVVSLTHGKAITMLDDGGVDLAVGLFRAPPKRFSRSELYQERYVCLANRHLPLLGGRLSLDSFVALPHLRVAHDMTGIVDEALAVRNLKRRVAIIVPNFAVVPYALENTDLLTVVGERIGRQFGQLGLVEGGVSRRLRSWNRTHIPFVHGLRRQHAQTGNRSAPSSRYGATSASKSAKRNGL